MERLKMIIEKINEIRADYETSKREVVKNYENEKNSLLSTYKEDVAKEKLEQLKSNSKAKLEELKNNFITTATTEVEKVESEIMKKTESEEVDKTELYRYKTKEQIAELEKEEVRNKQESEKLTEMKKNNLLMTLNLVKDNVDAIETIIDENKDNREILAFIEMITSNMNKESRSKIKIKLREIRNSYPENRLEIARANLKYYAMQPSYDSLTFYDNDYFSNSKKDNSYF